MIATSLKSDVSPLFSPYRVGELDLPNRIVMAPMTRNFSPAGVPGPDVAAYYARRADLGLLITEGAYIDHPTAGARDDVPRLYGEASLDGWRRVVDEVHARGGRIIPQLWHVGAQRPAGAPPHPDAPVLSPSGVDVTGAPAGRAATTADIDGLIAGYARSAKNAQAVGFDGLEIHGAHGYLLDEFFWQRTNRRTDGYGGDIAGRVRLATEVVRAVRAEVGPDFPVSYRFSQWKMHNYDARIAGGPDELERYLVPLAEAGVSLWHVSTRRYWLPAFDSSPVTLAGWTKRITGMPTIALGSVGVATPFLASAAEGEDDPGLAPLVRLLEAGEFDLVGVGRAVLSDPQWAQKVRSGRLGEIRRHDRSHLAELV